MVIRGAVGAAVACGRPRRSLGTSSLPGRDGLPNRKPRCSWPCWASCWRSSASSGSQSSSARGSWRTSTSGSYAFSEFRVTPHIPIGPSWLMEAAQDITALGGRTMLLAVTLFAIGYLALEGKHGAMWLVTIAAGGGGLLSTILKHLFGRDRPDVVPHLVAVTSQSFPSGHSMLAAILYLTLGALLARFAARRRTRVYMLTVALFVTFVVGSSRVYLGVHYPTDVLAGWCAGLVWALMCWLVARYLQARGAVEKPGRG